MARASLGLASQGSSLPIISVAKQSTWWCRVADGPRPGIKQETLPGQAVALEASEFFAISSRKENSLSVGTSFAYGGQ
jgi:hypothetical protein